MSGLKLSELKPGAVVWWTTNHWNNPCIITEVNRKRGTFKVFDLNDIRETDDILIGKPNCCSESPLTEMRIPTEDEFIEYLNKKLESRLTKEKYNLLMIALKAHDYPTLLVKLLHKC